MCRYNRDMLCPLRILERTVSLCKLEGENPKEAESLQEKTDLKSLSDS